MKKVLIITYYWPPSGGAGVQRFLKFVKYLNKTSWIPIVYTPENPEYPVLDHSLLSEIPKDVVVLKKKIWEPYGFYKRILGIPDDVKINTGFLTESKKNNFLEKISVWVRGNFFIPDARKFWIKPSVKFLKKYIIENKISTIITTGPPHSMHLIGLNLKRSTGVKWIADFRDPWVNIDYYQDLMLTKSSDNKHKMLEKQVIMGADKVIAIGDSMAAEFTKEYSKDVFVIPNGFDPNDFTEQTDVAKNKLYITHIGTLVKTRNPILLWNVLKKMKDSQTPNFIEVRDSIESMGLLDSVEFIDYLPHSSIISYLKSSSLLLLVLNNTPNLKGILTGKLFEYLAARRPILCFGTHDGDAAKVILNTKSGNVFESRQSSELLRYINNMLVQYNSGGIPNCIGEIDNYSREYQTDQLVEILNSVQS